MTRWLFSQARKRYFVPVDSILYPFCYVTNYTSIYTLVNYYLTEN